MNERVRCPKCSGIDTGCTVNGELGKHDVKFDCECFECEHKWTLRPEQMRSNSVDFIKGDDTA